MKSIIKSLMTRKTSVVIMIIEMIIAMVYFISMACSMQKVFIVNIETPKEITCKVNRLIETVFDDLDEKTFKKIKKELNKNKNIECCSYIDVESGIDINKNIETNYIRISEGFLKIKNFDISKGRQLNKEDFTENKAGILVGENIAKQRGYSIGDSFKYIYENEKIVDYKIVGLIKKDEKVFSQDITDGTVADLNEAIILPIIEDNVEYVPEMRCYSLIKDKADEKELMKVIKRSFDKYNVRCETYLVSDKLNEIFEKNYQSNKKWLIISLVIIFLSIVGVLTSLAALIYNRRREIGIRLALGYSKKDVKLFIISEVAVMTIISYIMALGISFYMYNFKKENLIHKTVGLYLSKEIVLVTSMIALFYILLSAIIVFIILREIQVRELLEET